MKRLITSGAVGNKHNEFLLYTEPLFKEYAQRYNTDYERFIDYNFERPASWYKVKALEKFLQNYDEVLWIDSDVVIKNKHENIFDELSTTNIQGVVAHTTPEGYIPNLGVWIVKKQIKELLPVIWEQKQFIYHGWWEQVAMLHLMEFDVKPKLTMPRNENNIWWSKTKILHSKWNWHKVDKEKVRMSSANFIHCTACGDRLGLIKKLTQK